MIGRQKLEVVKAPEPLMEYAPWLMQMARELVFYRDQVVPQQGMVIEALLDRIKPTLSAPERRKLLLEIGEGM